MDYNYHTHTYRCSHATGTEREYIEKAISAGIKKLGFSDHIPLVFSDGSEYYYRIPKVQEDEYIDTIFKLRDEYKEKIEIFVGYETEYYPEYFSQMIVDAKAHRAQYLILGQHSVGDETESVHWSSMPTDDKEKLICYTNCVVSAMKSGYITYVAHPDIFNFIGDKKLYEREMRKICKCSNETNTPLEINFLGIRDNRHYPNEDFWKIAGEEKCSVVFGFDAHDVSGAGDLESLSKARGIVEKYKLNYLENPSLKLL